MGRVIKTTFLVLCLVIIGTTSVGAVALAGQCGWCGGVCRTQTMGQVCTEVMPPEGLTCVSENGTCVVKGKELKVTPTKALTAQPTIKYVKEGEMCFGVSIVCEPGLKCDSNVDATGAGGICVKFKCTSRPPCLDETPKCNMPELEDYCPPKVTLTSTPKPTGIIVGGDANGDEKVDLVDFGIWKSEYLEITPTVSQSVLRADFNQDGLVNLVDFGIWKR